MTPPGIELATFRFVAQHLNHCATAVPHNIASCYVKCTWGNISQCSQEECDVINCNTSLLINTQLPVCTSNPQWEWNLEMYLEEESVILSLNVRNKLNEWESVQDSDMNIYSIGGIVIALSDFHVMMREILLDEIYVERVYIIIIWKNYGTIQDYS